MSMGQRKGKQKIEMKKVEAYADRMVTFSKRKSGIHKKLSDIVTMCDAEVAFLVFTEAGKPYTFAHPSMEKVADRCFGERESSAKNEDALVEAYKKERVMNLMQNYVKAVEDLDMEKEKEKKLKESNEMEGSKQIMWWKHSLEGLSVDELEQRHQTFEELYNSMRDMALSRQERSDEGSSSDEADVGCGSGEV